MTLAAGANVRAVPNFVACLRAANASMTAQDAASAPVRFARLQAELVKARGLLGFSPSSGRPARFFDATTSWGRYQAQRAFHLAQTLGLPELRELVLARHIVLYAHSDTDVLLLSLRHERQSGHRLGP